MWKYGKARQAIDENLRCLCMRIACWITTNSESNTYFISTLRVVMRTRLGVTFIHILRVLLCLNLIYRVNLQISYFLRLYLCAECGGISPNVDSGR